MKSKKSIYVLLPIVLLIWGLVINQFFSFSSNDFKGVVESKEYALKPLKLKPRDTSAINVNYRDPFLGKIYLPKNQNTNKRKMVKRTNPKLNAEPIILATIVYKGIVSDTKEKKKVFMLIINGQTFLMKKGDVENEVLLKDGNRESINVKNKETLQSIPIQV